MIIFPTTGSYVIFERTEIFMGTVGRQLNNTNVIKIIIPPYQVKRFMKVCRKVFLNSEKTYVTVKDLELALREKGFTRYDNPERFRNHSYKYRGWGHPSYTNTLMLIRFDDYTWQDVEKNFNDLFEYKDYVTIKLPHTIDIYEHLKIKHCWMDDAINLCETLQEKMVNMLDPKEESSNGKKS